MGNVVPFDGIVVEGNGAVNQSSITGESLPVLKENGGYVYAYSALGTAIGGGSSQTQNGGDATVTITFDPRDIELSFIDITDFTTSENKSVFGSSYNPEQVAAFERIARESIQEKTDSDTNRLQAKINLESYFATLANDLNVNIKVNEK